MDRNNSGQDGGRELQHVGEINSFGSFWSAKAKVENKTEKYEMRTSI